MLLAGSDLILTMSEPGVWSEDDVRAFPIPPLLLARTDSRSQLHHILGKYGCYIIERAESELDKAIFSSSSVHSRSIVALYQQSIELVDQLVRNDISSTKVRMFIRKGMSVQYLIPSGVVKVRPSSPPSHSSLLTCPRSQYIARNGLYRTADGKGGRLRDVPEREAGPHDHSNLRGEPAPLNR